MPAGKYFRGLTTFDLLGNLLPGTVILIAFVAIFPKPPVPTTPGEYLLAGVFAFSVGHFVQAHASSADGDQRSFDWTWEKARQLARPPVTTDSDEDDEEVETNDEDDSVENPADKWVKITYPLFGPVLWRCYRARGTVLLDEVLANRLWLELQHTYKFDYGTDEYSFVYRLMSSEIDDVSAPSRALRFQALRNFHRGMWIATWWALLILFVPDAVQHVVESGNNVFGVTYQSSGLLNYWTPTWHIYVVLLTAIYGFWYMAQSFTEEFIEYLFTDYAVTVKDRLGDPAESRRDEQTESGRRSKTDEADGTTTTEAID